MSKDSVRKRIDPKVKKEVGVNIRLLMSLCGVTTKTASEYFDLSETSVRNYTYGRVRCNTFVESLREMFNRITFGDTEGMPIDSVRMSRMLNFIQEGNSDFLFEGSEIPAEEPERLSALTAMQKDIDMLKLKAKSDGQQ